jgi:hypothetical protein
VTSPGEADALFGLPLERFVSERGALARALRAGRRREEAAAVAALRRPSLAAWAVNQLVRTQPEAVRGLFAAGDAVRAAHADLLAGRGDGRALRAASDDEREAVQGLVQTARGLLSSDGHELSEPMVQRVADTLHAAALDEAAREQVRGGRLERELRHVGLGLGAAAEAPAPEGDRRAEHERAARRKAARAEATAARRRAQRATRALATAQERRDRAARKLAEADAALAQARTEAETAGAEQRRTQAAADDA